MVGTLRCRSSDPAVEISYGQFVTRHKGTLNSSALVLKGHFLREIGIAGGQDAYDRFATWLSNRHSARHDAPSFCATIDLYSRMAAVASDENFVAMAQAAVDGPISGRCNPAAPGAPTAGVMASLAVRPLEAPIRAEVDAVDIANAMAAEAALPAPDAGEPVAAPLPADPVASAALAPASAAPAAAMPATAAPTPAAAVVPATLPAAPTPAPLAVPAGAVLIADAPIVPPQTVAEAPPTTPTRSSASLKALQDAVKALQAATEALAAQQTTPI